MYRSDRFSRAEARIPKYNIVEEVVDRDRESFWF